MTPGERWLTATWPVVRACMPAASARVVEVGCGPLGWFVPMLRANRYDAVGIDPRAPDDAHYQRIGVPARGASSAGRRRRRLHLTASRRRSSTGDRPHHQHAQERWRARRRGVGLGEVRPANSGVVLRTPRTRRRSRLAPSPTGRMARLGPRVAELRARLGGARRAASRRCAGPPVGRPARAPAPYARALFLCRSCRHNRRRRADGDRRRPYPTDPHRLRRHASLNDAWTEPRMEPLWSPVVATRGNQPQIGRPSKPQKQAKSVATGCHRLPQEIHGKEGVDGSSPSEGSAKVPHNGAFFSDRLAGSRTWGRYGALYGAFRSKTRSLSAGSLTTVRFRRRPNGAPRGSGSHPGPTISITD